LLSKPWAKWAYIGSRGEGLLEFIARGGRQQGLHLTAESVRTWLNVVKELERLASLEVKMADVDWTNARKGTIFRTDEITNSLGLKSTRQLRAEAESLKAFRSQSRRPDPAH